MNSVYIKHYADEDSLTHYGVKGMKWRKHKTKHIDDQYLSELAYNSKKNPEPPTYSSISSKKVPWYKAKAPWYGKQKQAISSVKKFGTKSLKNAKKSISKGGSWFKNKLKKKPKGYMYVFDGSKLDKYGRPKRVKQAYY